VQAGVCGTAVLYVGEVDFMFLLRGLRSEGSELVSCVTVTGWQV